MSTERKSIISATWDKAASTITFGVKDIGVTVLEIGKALACNEHAMYHGYEQKVRDSAAIPRDTKTGRSASPQEKFDAMEAVVEQLHQGLWNARTSRESALNRQALFAAVAEVSQREVEEVEAKFRDRQDEVLRTFLTRKDIAAVYARLTARDSGQADSLMAELE